MKTTFWFNWQPKIRWVTGGTPVSQNIAAHLAKTYPYCLFHSRLLLIENINEQLMKYDCGIAILVTAINCCDTLLSCASMVAAGGAVTLRLRLAVEQYVKLEHLYELYKSEITSYWPDIKITLGTMLIAVVADIVLGENKKEFCAQALRNQ